MFRPSIYPTSAVSEPSSSNGAVSTAPAPRPGLEYSEPSESCPATEGVPIEPHLKRAATRQGARAALRQRVRRAPHLGLPTDAALPAEGRTPLSAAAAPLAAAWEQPTTNSAHGPPLAESVGQYTANPVSHAEAELPSARQLHSWRAASVKPDAAHGGYSAGRPNVEHINAEETSPGNGGGSSGSNIRGTNHGLDFSGVSTHIHSADTLLQRSASVQLSRSEGSPSAVHAANACAKVQPSLQAHDAETPSMHGARSGARASGHPLELPSPASELLWRETSGAAAREPPSPSFSAMEQVAAAAAAHDWGSLSHQVLSLHRLNKEAVDAKSMAEVYVCLCRRHKVPASKSNE